MKTRNPSQNEITLGSKEYHDMQSDKVCCWVFTVVGHVCCETCLAQQQSWVQAKYLKSSKFQNPQKKSLYPNLNNFCWIPRFAFSFEIFKKKQVSVSFQSAPKTTNQPTTPEKNFRKKKKTSGSSWPIVVTRAVQSLHLGCNCFSSTPYDHPLKLTASGNP